MSDSLCKLNKESRLLIKKFLKTNNLLNKKPHIVDKEFEFCVSLRHFLSDIITHLRTNKYLCF